MQFIKYNPTRIVELVIESNTAKTFEQQIVYGPISPFSNEKRKKILLTKVTRPDQFNDKKGFLDISRLNVQLDNQNVILFKVGAGEKISITYKIGGILNTAASLVTKAAKAQVNMNRMQMGRRR